MLPKVAAQGQVTVSWIEGYIFSKTDQKTELETAGLSNSCG